MTRIWLIGMSGTGKTTAGRRAAAILDVPFIDTDALAEERSGATIPELWHDGGEPLFRTYESAVISDLDDATGVVAGGGGAVLDPGSREVIGGSERVVWLEATPELIAERIGQEGRPLFAGGVGLVQLVTDLLEQRQAIYQRLATHRIDTSQGDVGDVAEEIAGLWPA
jgi:shikimate kinase